MNALSPITGPVAVCPGLTITEADAAPGGRWISSAPAMASIGSSTGIITGVAAGTSVISYLLPTGCLAQSIVSVGAMAPITGPSMVCVGQAIALSDITPGGTWSTSAPTIATVGTTGTVTGVAGGLTANITYSIGTTCRAVKTITVNALTATSIPGTIPLCAGTTVNASNTTGGGIWSSGNTAIATVGSTGVITGVSAGSVVISYSLPTGCTALATVTVNPLSPITGMGNVCLWQTLTLSDATPGGVWTSMGTSATIATIGSSSGIVTGIAANLNATLTYTMGSGCKAYATVSVRLCL